jgi:hypothetical protein
VREFAQKVMFNGPEMSEARLLSPHRLGDHLLIDFGLLPIFPPFISRVRRLFRPSWGVV